MIRRCSLLVVFVGVLGLVGLAPVAQADHDATKPPGGPHEGPPVPPTPESVAQRFTNKCDVAGTVNIGDQNGTGGIGGGDGNHNHYRFEQTAVVCHGTDQNLNGTFAIEAAGGTDGFDPLAGGAHGEQTSIGWSHSSCYSAAPGCASSPKKNVTDLYAGTNTNPHTGNTQNFGEITASGTTLAGTPASSTSTDNWIKFCRGVYDFNTDLALDCAPSIGGGNVIVWGALADWPHLAGADVCFYGNLVLEPTGVNANVVEKINNAALVGSVSIWKAAKSTCHGPTKFKK